MLPNQILLVILASSPYPGPFLPSLHMSPISQLLLIPGHATAKDVILFSYGCNVDLRIEQM